MATAPAPAQTAPDDSVIPFEQATGQPAPAAAPPATTQTAPAPGAEGRQVTVRARPAPKPPPAPIAPHETAPVSVQPNVLTPDAPDQKPPPDEGVIKFEDAAPQSAAYPGLATDIGKGVWGGLAEGVEGLGGMGRDIPALADYGMAWAGAHANQMFGDGEDAKASLERSHGSLLRRAIGDDAYNQLSALPVPGAAGIKSFAVQHGLDPNYKPQSLPGRYAHEIAAFLPGALIPGGEATLGARALQTVAPAVASETLGHAVEGTSYEPWARVFGAGLGGLTQTMAGKFAQPLTAGGQQDMAAGWLRDRATDPDAALARARATQATTPPNMAIGENIPGSKPTLSQVTQDPGLVGAETDYQTANAVQHSQRWNAQQEAQSNALAGIQQGGDSTKVADLITNNLQQIDQQHEAKVQAALQTHAREQQTHAQGVEQAETAARTAAGEVARKGEPEALGANARKAIADSMTKARAREQVLWDAINPDGKIGIYPHQIGGQARNIPRQMGRMQKPMEGEEKSIFEKGATFSKKLTPLSDVTDFTSRLKMAMRQDRAANRVNTPALARMTQLLKTAENVIKNAATRHSVREAQEARESLRQMTPQDRANLTAYRTARTARGNIERGPMGQVLRQGETSGSYRTMDSQVPGKIFAKGDTGYQKAKAYADATGKPWLDPFQDLASDSLARHAMTPDGMIDPVKLTKWQEDHEGALRALPTDVHQKFLQGPAEAAAVLTDTATQRRAAMIAHSKIDVAKQIGKSPADAMRRDPMLKGFEGKTTPEEVQGEVGKLFSQPTRLGQLRQYLLSQPGGANAAEGLKRAALDHMLEKVSTQTRVGVSGVKSLTPGITQKFIAQNKTALAAAGFTPQKLQMTDRVDDDIARQQSLYSTTIQRGSATAQKQAAALKKISKHAHEEGGWLAPLVGAGEIYEHIPESLHGYALGAAAVGAYGAKKLYSHYAEKGTLKANALYHDAIMNPDKGIDLLSRRKPNNRARELRQVMYGGLAAERHEALGWGVSANH